MVYIINGYPHSGKTYFARQVIDCMGEENAKLFSSVDTVKEIAYVAGWNGDKTPENRKFLSDLKKILVEWRDLPFQEACEKIKKIEYQWKVLNKDLNKCAIFIMCREPEEIERFVEAFGAKTILIRSKESDKISNSSDANVENYIYDFEIFNPMTEDIFFAIDDFIKSENLYYLFSKKKRNKIYTAIRKSQMKGSL